MGFMSEALAASVVKVAGRDVLATWKILISLGVAPVIYAFYAFLSASAARYIPTYTAYKSDERDERLGAHADGLFVIERSTRYNA